MQLFFKAKLKESPHCVVVMASSLQICIERRRLILIKIVYPNEKKISNTFFYILCNLKLKYGNICHNTTQGFNTLDCHSFIKGSLISDEIHK